MTAVTDEEAWALAIAMLRQSGEPVWVNNIEGMLESRGFEEAGRWASSQMQFLSLRSKAVARTAMQSRRRRYRSYPCRKW
jgi:hypothetical protein